MIKAYKFGLVVVDEDHEMHNEQNQKSTSDNYCKFDDNDREYRKL